MSTDPTPTATGESAARGVALYFDPDGYVELLGPPANRPAGGPIGLMGRQVAGKEFLDAYLSHGASDSLTAVVRAANRAGPLRRECEAHPSSRRRRRSLRVLTEPQYLAAAAAPRVLYFPCPPDSRFAWARHAAGSRFALCGVTHTLSSESAALSLCELLTAPYESYDALICTSRAVADLVRSVTGTFADYLADRFGGVPALRPRLEVIPLGVNPEKFRPPTADERKARRQQFGVGDDEVMVLCVGRLSHHAKAHPFPVYHAADQAARRTGRKVHLVFAGWAAHPAVDRAYRDGAARFAPAARVSFLDGQDPQVRSGVWPAADVVVSLPDNIQETFGLVVVEAMATALPVVGSDWDGYRDLIAHGETGFLVPTQMIRGATNGATFRLLFGQTNYDHFLGECSQAVTVDLEAAADALSRLVGDAVLRRQMGIAGRSRAVERFSWEKVVRAYETLWAEQEREVMARGQSRRAVPSPAQYPAPEESFAGYPSRWLTDSDLLRAVAGAPDVAVLAALPLTNVMPDRRCPDAAAIATLLKAADRPDSVGNLAAILERAGSDPVRARATIAWLLKYGVLRSP
jgi:D-inositol-3-phosphate glycosyltransferase